MTTNSTTNATTMIPAATAEAGLQGAWPSARARAPCTSVWGTGPLDTPTNTTPHAIAASAPAGSRLEATAGNTRDTSPRRAATPPATNAVNIHPSGRRLAKTAKPAKPRTVRLSAARYR